MNLFETIRQRFSPVQPLPAGTHHVQCGDGQPYRLHLRLHGDGSGLLIVNASTVLHLNATAAEFAFHFIKGNPPEDVAKQVAGRYRIDKTQAQHDFEDFVDRIQTLIDTPDLDPISYLDFERTPTHDGPLSAPLRLDCALTYRLPEGAPPELAPVKNVTRDLDTAEWQRILDSAWAFGIPHVIFTGGEPTLRDDLTALIAHAEKNGQVTGLLTDGFKLADAAYLNTLLQTGLDHLMISITPGVEIPWQAIQNALVADIYLAIHITLTPANIAEASSLLTKLREIGVEAVSLSISDISLQEPLSRLRDTAADLNLHLVFDLPVPYSSANPVTLETAEDQSAAGAGKTWLYVEPDGDVLPGQGMSERVLGNLLRDELHSIYYGK